MPGTLYPLTVITRLCGRYSSFPFRIRIFFHRLFPHLYIKNNEKVPHTNYLSCFTWFLFNILVFGGILFHKISDVLCLVTQSCLTVCNPMDCSPPGSSVQGIFPGKNTGVGLHALLQGNLPSLGIEPRSPPLQADSLPSEPPGKPKNTGVGTLSLLKGIFLTQKSNQGLLHCRWILYQLSYQGSLKSLISIYKMYMWFPVYILYPCVYVCQCNIMSVQTSPFCKQ